VTLGRNIANWPAKLGITGLGGQMPAQADHVVNSHG